MQMRIALVAGASGLVGSSLLDELLADARYSQVISLGRRALPRQEPRLVQRTVDFARLGSEPLPLVDDAYCCLGTTIKKAGSREAFHAVDYEAVLAFARAAQRAGARRFLVVTALGANARSRVFYNRTKGEVEEALAGLGLESLVVAQPSLLLGERQESRPGERAAIVASRLLGPLLRPLPSRPIEARAVARALVRLAHEATPGVRVVRSGELQHLGR